MSAILHGGGITPSICFGVISVRFVRGHRLTIVSAVVAARKCLLLRGVDLSVPINLGCLWVDSSGLPGLSAGR